MAITAIGNTGPL